MAELVDARDSKSRGPRGRVGSSPTPGTFTVIRPDQLARTISGTIFSRSELYTSRSVVKRKTCLIRKRHLLRNASQFCTSRFMQSIFQILPICKYSHTFIYCFLISIIAIATSCYPSRTSSWNGPELSYPRTQLTIDQLSDTSILSLADMSFFFSSRMGTTCYLSLIRKNINE